MSTWLPAIRLMLIVLCLDAAALGIGDVPVRLDDRSPYFTVRSELPVGNKGDELIDVSVEQPSCGKPVWAFDHAELVVQRSRFGEAQFVGLPDAGCIRCKPIRIRWYHEPTGHLSFSVNVYRRLTIGDCS